MSARPRRRSASRSSLVFLLCLAVPTVAQAATLTVEDEVISIAECSDRSNQAVELAWDLSSSSGSSIEILGIGRLRVLGIGCHDRGPRRRDQREPDVLPIER